MSSSNMALGTVALSGLELRSSQHGHICSFFRKLSVHHKLNVSVLKLVLNSWHVNTVPVLYDAYNPSYE